MTDYRQYGYVVSASSDESSGYRAYHAFNDAVSLETDAWLGILRSLVEMYNASGK